MREKGTFVLKFRDKEWTFPAGMTVRDAIKKAGLQVEGVLPVIDGKLVTEDTITKPGDEIRLVAVVSGG